MAVDNILYDNFRMLFCIFCSECYSATVAKITDQIPPALAVLTSIASIRFRGISHLLIFYILFGIKIFFSIEILFFKGLSWPLQKALDFFLITDWNRTELLELRPLLLTNKVIVLVRNITPFFPPESSVPSCIT